MILKNEKFTVYITPTYFVEAYSMGALGKGYFCIYSLELPCVVVVHESMMDGENIYLSDHLREWVLSNVNAQLSFSEEYFNA